MKTKQLVILNTLIFSSLSLTAVSAESAMPKVGGFLDAQYQWRKEAQDPGFVLNDGAVYLSHEMENVSLMIDLPFKYSATAADFDFAKTKAQGYLTYQAAENVSFTLGQFDTPYGLEANDSKDIIFNQSGTVSGAFLPIVHTGLVAEISHPVSDELSLKVKGMVANPRDTGTLGGDNVEFGAHLGVEHSMLRAGAGWLSHNVNGSDGTRNLYSFTAGTSVSNFSVDAEYDIIKNPEIAAEQGMMLIAKFQATDELSVAARGEHIRKGTNRHRFWGTTFGPQYQLAEGLTAKADYTYSRTTPTAGAAKVTDHAINVGAVAAF